MIACWISLIANPTWTRPKYWCWFQTLKPTQPISRLYLARSPTTGEYLFESRIAVKASGRPWLRLSSHCWTCRLGAMTPLPCLRPWLSPLFRSSSTYPALMWIRSCIGSERAAFDGGSMRRIWPGLSCQWVRRTPGDVAATAWYWVTLCRRVPCSINSRRVVLRIPQMLR